MQVPKHQVLELAGTAALAFSHLWLASLAFLERLSFTQPSYYEVIELAADSVLWGWIFGVLGLSLVLALVWHPNRHRHTLSRLCSASAASLGAWAFFTLLWGLSATFPVSLAVFGPAVFAVVGAQVLAVSWNHKE